MLGKSVFCFFLLCTSFVHCQNLQLSNGGARLVIYPQNVFLNAFTGKPLDLLCIGETYDEDSLTEFKWLNPLREEIPEGSPGVERIDSNTLLLSFVNPTVTDSGNYKCTAIYAESDYLEAEVSVLFYENIEFENCSEHQLLFKSEDDEITCHVNSSKESSITWTKDKKKIESGRYTFTASGITIENVKEKDAGLYALEVFEPRTGSFKSRSINVDVSDRDAKDVIGIDKLFILEVTDSSVRFDVRLSGEVWGIETEYREKLSESEESISWAQGDVFEVRNLIPSGRYRFRFRPRPSKTTKWFNYLDVTLLPEAPKVVYSYKPSGNLELEYVWTTDDTRRGTINKYRISYQKVQKMPDGFFKRSKCIVIVDIPPCFGSKYTITDLSNATLYEINVTAHTSAGFGKSSSQTLEVRTSNTNGSRVQHSVLLLSSLVLPVSTTYEVKLVLSPSNKDFNVSISKPFEVMCKGEPSDDKFANMHWIDPKGEKVSDGQPRVLKTGPTSLKLLFTDPAAEDGGIYECIAEYGKEHDLNTKVSINFYGSAPTFQTKYERITAEEGSEVEITCSAMGDKPITYTWYNQHEQVIRGNWDSSISTSESENGSTLVIRPVRRGDEGSYTCTAGNYHGLSSKVYDITVTPSTNNDTRNETAIRYIRRKNVTFNSVQFDISTSDGVSSIQVVYKESKELIEYRKEWKRGDAYIVRNLIPAGLYNFHFRAISTNTGEENNSTWSDAYSVILLPDAPEVIFRSLGTDSVKIEWFRNFDDIMRGTIDKYQLKYYKVQMERGRTWKASDCVVTIELPTCFGNGYTIAGLSHTVYYELQMQAHTASGYGNPYKQKIYVP